MYNKNLRLESRIRVEELKKNIADIHPVVQTYLHRNRKAAGESSSPVNIANFVDWSDLGTNEILSLLWSRLHLIVKTLKDYEFQVEDLQNGTLKNLHVSRLKLYRDYALDATAIIRHFISSETLSQIYRLLRLEQEGDELNVIVWWKGFLCEDDTVESLELFFEDFTQMIQRLLQRKKTKPHLAHKYRQLIGL